MGKVGGEGSAVRSLTWGCGWVNTARGVWNLLLEALFPEPRQCPGHPRGGEAVAGGMELVSLDSRGNHWVRDGQCSVQGEEWMKSQSLH